MEKTPLLSICIPTCKRIEILKNTLNSIYSQNIDPNLFEVCISDNSPTDETKEMLNNYFNNIPNIFYSKSTCEGFYNSIEALKLGKGTFLKLHNDYTKFKTNVLSNFINFISQNMNSDSVLFFHLVNYKSKKETIEIFDNFDKFMNKISFYSTWSTSFGIFKKDFEILMQHNVQLDKMYPHTSLLFELDKKKHFIINNHIFFENQDLAIKGGYNLPETFGTRYLNMCNTIYQKGKISYNTFEKIKKGILTFISEWYCNVKLYPNKYTFSFDNWETIIGQLYGYKGIRKIKCHYKIQKIKFIIKNYIKHIYKK